MESIKKEMDLDLSEEQPILTLKLKCSSEDYQKAMQVAPQKYTRKIKLIKWMNILAITAIILTFSMFLQDLKNHDYSFPRLVFILLGITLMNLYHYHCYKRHRIAFMKGLSKILLKRLSKLYWGYSIDEIKRMIIPCELIFYETYMIKKTPSVEDVKKVTTDKVIDLPLSGESRKYKYLNLKYIGVNDDYISFCRNCFIPKKQLNETESEQVNIILDELGV